jgi:hypothetical protein
MRCDPQASLLARNLASPCLGREPKARVVTLLLKYKDLFAWIYKDLKGIPLELA